MTSYGGNFEVLVLKVYIVKYSLYFTMYTVQETETLVGHPNGRNLGRFIFFRIEKGLRLNFGSEFLKSVRVLLKNLDYSEEKLPEEKLQFRNYDLQARQLWPSITSHIDYLKKVDVAETPQLKKLGWKIKRKVSEKLRNFSMSSAGCQVFRARTCTSSEKTEMEISNSLNYGNFPINYQTNLRFIFFTVLVEEVSKTQPLHPRQFKTL